MKKVKYLFPHDYMAYPSTHVFNGRLYIYPSHDWESEVLENDNGGHFNIVDYHVFSLDSIDGEITDHGVILDVKHVPWAGRQLWDNDVAFKNGKYYMYYSMKDKNDVFHLGIAISDTPEGPFIPRENPIKGSYSIDPCAFDDGSAHYVLFGGLWGGQLQRYRNNKKSVA